MKFLYNFQENVCSGVQLTSGVILFREFQQFLEELFPAQHQGLNSSAFNEDHLIQISRSFFSSEPINTSRTVHF